MLCHGGSLFGKSYVGLPNTSLDLYGLFRDLSEAEGGPTFGPEFWAGDAIVTGYSRGKLYRTKLVKAGSEYVAQNQLFACLKMLACDVCVSPRVTA